MTNSKQPNQSNVFNKTLKADDATIQSLAKATGALAASVAYAFDNEFDNTQRARFIECISGFAKLCEQNGDTTAESILIDFYRMIS